MNPRSERFPVLIVAGFLGSGKTTFIRELLPKIATGPRAPYVILNDFVNADIDASSLKGLGAKIKALAAGCVCCDDSDSLIDAIMQVPASINPLIIIEANGTTDPYRLIETLTLAPEIRERIGVIRQVTIINESRWCKRLLPGDKRTERAQVRTASAVISNRSESATDKQKQKLRNDLLELNPRAPKIESAEFIELLLQESFAVHLPEPDLSEPMLHTHLHVAVFMVPPSMSEEALRKWLVSLPTDVIRVKGLMRLSDNEMAYFNRTDDPFEAPRIIRIEAQEGLHPAVVFIGPGLKEDFLRASFTAETKEPTFKMF